MRRNTACSLAVSRPWLKASAAHRVWRRCKGYREPSASSVKRWSSRAIRPSSPSRGTRAAASSSASAMPSSRWHKATTRAALASVSANDGDTACTRVTRSCSALLARAASTPGAAGRASVPSRDTCSCVPCSGTWLVTSMRTRGAASLMVWTRGPRRRPRAHSCPGAAHPAGAARRPRSRSPCGLPPPGNPASARQQAPPGRRA